TSWPRDWSSDVCSSDLAFHETIHAPWGSYRNESTGHLLTRSGPDFPADSFRYDPQGAWMVSWNANARDSVAYDNAGRPTFSFEKIGRASCRDRGGWEWV